MTSQQHEFFISEILMSSIELELKNLNKSLIRNSPLIKLTDESSK